MSHQWADADKANDPSYEDSDGVYIGTVNLTDPGYDATVTSPPPGMTGIRQDWVYVVTTTDKTLTFSNRTFGSTADIVAGVWQRTGSTWTTIVAPPAAAHTQQVTAQLTAGVTYYLMSAFVDETEAQNENLIRWTAALTRSAAESNMDIPSVVVGVHFDVRPPGAGDSFEIPPVVVGVHPAVPSVSNDLPLPGVQVGVTIGIPQFWTGGMVLSAPEDGSIVLTDTPTFVVGITSPDDEAVYTLDVQYDDNAAFTSPVTLTATVYTTDGGAVFIPASAVPATTYWRARLSENGSVRIGWTSAHTFTTNTVITPSTFPVTWTVDSTTERPIHVWHFDPAGPIDGDTITLYGQGFPASGTLLFGDTVLPTLTWGLVPASADNGDDSTRSIDGDNVTPEHFEVTFAAPSDDDNGAVLSLEG